MILGSRDPVTCHQFPMLALSVQHLTKMHSIHHESWCDAWFLQSYACTSLISGKEALDNHRGSRMTTIPHHDNRRTRISITHIRLLYSSGMNHHSNFDRLTMTLISNDPIFLPLISFNHVDNYFLGWWRALVSIVTVSHWIFDAVASCITVAYDWGEPVVEVLIIICRGTYWYSAHILQYWHSDKRYVRVITGTAISLRVV
jgi:hypothetical protein